MAGLFCGGCVSWHGRGAVTIINALWCGVGCGGSQSTLCHWLKQGKERNVSLFCTRNVQTLLVKCMQSFITVLVLVVYLWWH